MSSIIIRIKTYKHIWHVDINTGVSVILDRPFYPLGFLAYLSKKLAIFGKSKKIIDDPSSIYDANTSFGQEFVSENDIKLQSERAKIFHSLLKMWDIKTEGKSILDLSGGNGVFVNEFKKMGARSVAHTEFSRDAVRYAKENLKINSSLYDINSDTLKNLFEEKFDIIMLRGCIEFCDNFKQFSEQLVEISHKNTIVILTFINPTLGVALRTQFDQYNVRVCRPPETVDMILREQGFKGFLDTEMFLYDRNYAYQHVKGRLALFYIFYLALNLFTLRKHQYPRDFHSLDCKCSVMAFKKS